MNIYIEFPHSLFISGFVTREIRRVTLVKLKQLAIRDHSNSLLFLWATFCSICVVFCRSLFVHLFSLWPLYCLSIFCLRWLIEAVTSFKTYQFHLHFVFASCIFYLDSILFITRHSYYYQLCSL